jgi:hypothetical protein
MKFRDNNIFEFLNYILKTNDTLPKDYDPPTFLVNRWLSMGNVNFSLIINKTTNRWCKKNRNFDITKFYRLILPKYNKRLTYIKKKYTQKDIDDSIQHANLMECSTREIEMFNDTLAELNICAK